MDFQRVFDTNTAQLNLQTNPTVYSGFRNEYLPTFQDDFSNYKPKSNDLNFIVRDWLSPDNKKKITDSFLKFTENTGQAVQATVPTAAPVAGKANLRFRYTIGESEDVKESLTTQVHDSAAADLFNYTSPNSENGEYNSLFLYNQLNEQLRYQNSEIKPLTNIPNVLGFNSTLSTEQFTPAIEQLYEIERSEMVKIPLENLHGIGILPGSNMREIEPFTQKERTSILIPGEIQPRGFSRDPNQPLAARFNNLHGFVPYYDQYRYPLQPSIQAGSQMSTEAQISQMILSGSQMF